MPAVDRDDALRELGRMAREIREDAGFSLEDVYEKTKVRVEYLEGIEHGVYNGFPDLVYVKGFVRTYLGVIGAEELKDEFMTWLNKEASSSSGSDRRLPPANVLGKTSSPTKGFKSASHFWLFAALFLVMAGSGYYVWYVWQNNPNGIPRFRPTAQTETPQDAPVSADESSADLFPLSRDNNFLSVLPPAVSAEPEPEPKPISPYLHIRATGEVWLEVRINDRVVLSDTLRSGAEVSWDLPARARVRYGRMNLAAVTLNGKTLPVSTAGGVGTYYYDPDGTFGRM